jgi:organic radical activating enzyme
VFGQLAAQAGYRIAVETNGTALGLGSEGWISWMTVSPKGPDGWELQGGNELKLVYWGQPIDWVSPVFDKGWFDHLYLQPQAGEGFQQSLNMCIQKIKEDPRWKLSLQMHKLLGIR